MVRSEAVRPEQTNFSWGTLVDLTGRGPLHERLTRALREAIRGGRLRTGSALPPSRLLADELGCSRWVVTQAYGQLAAEGYLSGRVGSATRVRWTGATTGPAPAAPAASGRDRLDLAPGVPDLRAFPRRAWGDALRRAVVDATAADLGMPPPAGHPVLRAVLAEYLTRARGAATGPEQVVVTTGATDALHRLCRALAADGTTAIAVEDPGLPQLREAAGAAGLAVRPVPVDADGLRVDELRGLPVGAVLVSPAHQFPTGTVLDPGRRAALTRWARESGGLIVEDDYDAEFRYDHRPVGTLQGTDPERVVLLGSVSKTLSPALRTGWLVLPPRWRARFAALSLTGVTPPVPDQLALAGLITTGGYDRHLRRARLTYRHRRESLLAALATHLPRCPLTGAAAGLHLVLHLPAGTDAAAVVSRAAATGLRLTALDRYTTTPAAPALVLGYGNLPDPAVEEAVTLLAAAIRDAVRGAAGARRSRGG